MSKQITRIEKENISYRPFDHSFIGPRMKHIRKLVGESREYLAELLGITVTQYGLLEAKSSASVRNFVGILNYFIINHNINPNWVLIKDNANIPVFYSEQKDVVSMINELNEKVKEQGLMVSLVPKV